MSRSATTAGKGNLRSRVKPLVGRDGSLTVKIQPTANARQDLKRWSEVTCPPMNKKFIGGEIFRRKVKLYSYLFSGVWIEVLNLGGLDVHPIAALKALGHVLGTLAGRHARAS